MKRVSRHSLEKVNKGKVEEIKNLYNLFQPMVEKYVNILWNNFQKKDPLFGMLPSNICNSIEINPNVNARLRQCAGKQACNMVKSALVKHNKRLYKLKQLQKEGKNTKYLQRKIEQNPPKKPNCKNINMELDPRFIDFMESNTSFDLFVRVHGTGNTDIKLPINYTKVSDKWKNSELERKMSIQLTPTHLCLYYGEKILSKEEQKKKDEEKAKVLASKTRKVGADQGQITCLTLSDGQTTQKNKHGYDLNKIQDILSHRQTGSKGFQKAQSHRKNYINWSLNQLDFSNIYQVNLEKITNIRKYKSVARKLRHWKYTLIKQKLVMLSEDKGFIFKEQDNKFRSQRCSACGWTHKSNRLKKTFKCKHCEYCTDSDLNAACNHEVDLFEIPWNHEVCQKHLNRTTGFFWFKDKIVLGQEPIVPDVKKGNVHSLL